MQKIYEPFDLWQAQMLVSMLASEGIDAHLQGAHLIGAMGELPALGLLALWVVDTEAERALQLIESYEQAEPLLEGDEPLELGNQQTILEC